MKYLIDKFLQEVKDGNIEIYNEFSFQHELGIFIRRELPYYKVQFERNISYFGICGTIKKEIDIVIFNDNEKHAIELKFPLNGQYPEQMFSFIKDIKFVEQLKENGFDSTYAVTLVEDKNFYEGNKQDGIYAFFRNSKEIHGLITKPTGKKDESFTVNGSYKAYWHTLGQYHYYIIENK